MTWISQLPCWYNIPVLEWGKKWGAFSTVGGIADMRHGRGICSWWSGASSGLLGILCSSQVSLFPPCLSWYPHVSHGSSLWCFPGCRVCFKDLCNAIAHRGEWDWISNSSVSNHQITSLSARGLAISLCVEVVSLIWRIISVWQKNTGQQGVYPSF